MVLGDAVSRLETFVWILSHISRSITWSLFTLKASYLVKWSVLTRSFMWWCQFIDWLKFETRPSSLLNFGTAYTLYPGHIQIYFVSPVPWRLKWEWRFYRDVFARMLFKRAMTSDRLSGGKVCVTGSEVTSLNQVFFSQRQRRQRIKSLGAKLHNNNNNKSKWHTRTPTHGLASTLRMRTAISPGQWQPWTVQRQTT